MNSEAILSILLGSLVLVYCTGCSSTGSFFGGSDFQISATEAGMQAYGDHLSALVTNAKASADAPDTPAYDLRRKQDMQRTIRNNGWQPNMGKPVGGEVFPK